ncbi:MAG: YajQ family cyclic di-GMP-binding protein [Gammaproteobacteria bacterium]|nr:MAG: YajQ family cyclic di-GMP-binding protein [Gammaproteobacteria bacterium]
MPSFDIVSTIDTHEINNAVDQANREVSTRFDFKGTNARVELVKDKITLIAPTDFQLKQVDEIFRNKLAKRQVDIRSMNYKEINTALNEAKQLVEVKQGIDSDNAKKITKLIKESGLKVQAAIQGDQIRVTGKKRDDLQEVIAMLKGAGAKVEIPLQFVNFRD